MFSCGVRDERIRLRMAWIGLLRFGGGGDGGEADDELEDGDQVWRRMKDDGDICQPTHRWTVTVTVTVMLHVVAVDNTARKPD